MSLNIFDWAIIKVYIVMIFQMLSIFWNSVVAFLLVIIFFIVSHLSFISDNNNEIFNTD